MDGRIGLDPVNRQFRLDSRREDAGEGPSLGQCGPIFAPVRVRLWGEFAPMAGLLPHGSTVV